MNRVRKRKSAADRKSEIVGTVIELSHALGPDRVTTQHLADAVGVSQPAIFRHFATKADIWDAVSHRLVEQITALPQTAQTNFGAIKAHMNGYLDLVRAQPAIPAILTSRELQNENRDLRERFLGLGEKRHGLVSKMVSHGQQAGELRTDVEADSAASIILSSLHQLSHSWSLSEHGFDLVAEGDKLTSAIATLLLPE